MWKKLEIDDLRTILSEDEVEALKTLSVKEGIDRIQSCLDLISDSWRAAIQAKGYEVYEREHWTPSSLHYWILVMARHAIWTNFPMSPAVALDEAREKEYQKALEFLKDIPFAIEEPDYSDDPDLSGNVDIKPEPGASIYVPWQRLDTWPNYVSNPWKNWKF